MVDSFEKELDDDFEDTVEFIPTESHKKVKAKLTALLQDNPLIAIDSMNDKQVSELLKEPRIMRWWNIDGFRDWFINKYDFTQRNEELITLAYDTIESLLKSTNPKLANAQVAAAKMLVEVGRRMPSKRSEVRFTDENINRMDPLQLEEYLKKAGYVRISKKEEPLAIEGEVITESSSYDKEARTEEK